MSEAARLRRDVGWNLVPVVLLAGVGLGMQLVIAGWWDEEALGAFNLVTAAFFAFAVVGACGVQYSVLRAVAEASSSEDRIPAIVAGALVPNVALAALATLAFAVLADPVGDLLGSDTVAAGMRWAAPGLFCFAVNKVLLGVVNGLRRMRAFAVYTSLRYLLIALGLVLAYAWHLDADQLPVIWTFTEGALLLVLLVEVLAQVRLSRGRGWPAHARAHLGFGVRGVLATLAFEVNSKLDVWMLGIAVDDATVGVYSMASALTEGAMQLGVVLQNNLNPIMARSTTGEIAALARRTRRWFVPAFVAICAVAAVAYPVVIPWLVGKPSFAAGAVPFAIMMAALALASPYLPFGQLLLMAARPGWHTVYVLGIIATNFAVNLVAIGPLGPTGAALGLASSIVVSALLLRILVRWRTTIQI